jgi:unsaturated chondroitin disaccharide hydrolase
MGYYVAESPPDLVPHWDFEVPNPEDEPRDTSAAALVAYGLSRLDSDEVPPAHRERVSALRKNGERVLASLVRDYMMTDPDDDRYGMVQHGCYNRPGGFGDDNELVWTDYYVASALDSLAG